MKNEKINVRKTQIRLIHAPCFSNIFFFNGRNPEIKGQNGLLKFVLIWEK
jgi:hypothetical protein